MYYAIYMLLDLIFWDWLWDGCIYVTERNSSVSLLFFNVPCEGLVLGFPRPSKRLGKSSLFFSTLWMSLILVLFLP